MTRKLRNKIYESRQGESLEKYLTEARKLELRNERYFYIISANIDNHDRKTTAAKIFKLGQGGKGSEGAGRLINYIYYYGKSDKKRPYQGVKIHYLKRTIRNKTVQSKNTKIHKLELNMKRYIKSNKLLVDRGSERFQAKIDDIFKLLKKKDFDTHDTPNKPTTYNLRGRKKRYIKNILDHKNKGVNKKQQGPTTFKVLWNDGRISQELPYDIKSTRFVKMLDNYMKKVKDSNIKLEPRYRDYLISDEVLDGEYEVEQIVSELGNKYEVKWVGYPHSENTLEPKARMLKSVPKLVNEYEQSK